MLLSIEAQLCTRKECKMFRPRRPESMSSANGSLLGLASFPGFPPLRMSIVRDNHTVIYRMHKHKGSSLSDSHGN